MINRFEPGDSDPHFDNVSKWSDRLDQTVISLPCYEPSGGQIEFNGRALATHTILLGQTGCGKTSVLRWFIKGLIGHTRDDLSNRPGVFIFDLNGDDTVGLVRKWAAESGRSNDVCLLTQDTGHLNLFAHIRSYEDLPAATAQFMHQGWVGESENGYWGETTRTLIDAALSICLTVTGRLETDTVLRFLTNWLIAKRPTKEDEGLLAGFEAMASAAETHLDTNFSSKIAYVRATIEMWNKLEPKTRSILNSCLVNALGPLISMETRRYLDNTRGTSFVPEDIVNGKIMVFSLPAGKHLESASLLGRILKARLYVALQDRAQNQDQRICAVIADEYHYLASGGVDRSSDVTALATLRSRSVAVIAATQSLSHLAAVMGRDFRSLLPNYGNHLFFRSVEGSTGAFATAVMGTYQPEKSPQEDLGSLMAESSPPAPRESVCPPSALAVLEPGQAYVATSTGYRSKKKVWLAGNFEQPGAALDRKEPQHIIDPLQGLREATLAKPAMKSPVLATSTPLEVARAKGEFVQGGGDTYYDIATWYRLLREARFRRTPYPTFESFRQALANYGHQPGGLDTLPICWWQAVVKLTLRFSQQHAMTLMGMHQVEGSLVVLLSGTDADPDTYLNWIQTLQDSLYPIRTRPLKERDARIIALAEGEEMPWHLHEPDDDDANA